MIERLPQFAEHHVAGLSAEAGVVCNASDQDECGWDFFLQFAARQQAGRPADMQPSGPEALVQVKSTRGEPLVARMKLSNALRAARAAQPFFVVLVVAGDDRLRVYARHFWEAEIARTLRRVRLAERDGGQSFHRRHFDIRMEPADAHDDDLLAWMRTTIEAVRPGYAAAKIQIYASVGHEDGFGSVSVALTGPPDDLLDLQLGLVESIPIASARYVSKRFGIEAARPEFEIDDARLFATPTGKPARLRLQGGSPTTELMVDAMLYSATLPGAEPEHRWRLDAGPLRILGAKGACSATMSLRLDEARPIGELVTFLTIAAWRGSGPVGVQLLLGEERVPMGTLTLDADEDDPEWPAVRDWAQALHAIAQAAHAEAPSVSILDLHDARAPLARFASMVAASSIRMEYEPLGEDDPTRAALYFAGCDVGDRCFLAVVERNTLSDERHGKRRSLTFGVPRLLDTLVARGCWRDRHAAIDEAYRAQIERLGAPETLWELGDIEAFFARVLPPAD